MVPKVRSMLEIAACATSAIMLGACSYHPPVALTTPAGLYQTLNTAPYATPYSSDRWTVIDDSGRLRVDHGFDCASASRAASSSSIGIRVQSRVAIPAGYDATVFMNGWSTSYKKKDHHVMGLGSIIFNIERQGDDLVWDAGGVIADKNGDDGYKWCGEYTILFWPRDSSEFDMRAVHSDSTGRLFFHQEGANTHLIPASFTTTGSGRPPRAALPAGFALLTGESDRHLLQAGFDLGNQSLTGTTLAWTSKAVFKDNARNSGAHSFEVASILRGNNFGVSHPSTVLRQEADGSFVPRSNALEISPRTPTSCGGATLNQPNDEQHVYHFKVTNIRSSYAIPMLTGWDLSYTCEDQHVRSIGAWIEDFHYDAPVGFGPGTLEYTIRSTLADKDGSPGFFDKFEVSILNINLPGRLISDLPVAGTLQPANPIGGGVVQPPGTGGGVQLR